MIAVMTASRALRFPAIAVAMALTFSLAGQALAKSTPSTTISGYVDPPADWSPKPAPAAPKTTQPPPPPVEHASSDVPARFDVGLGYAYMRPEDEVVRNLNGFTVFGFYNVNSWLAFGGEFSGLYGSVTESRQFMVGDMKKDFDVKTSLDRYFYGFGPQVTLQPCRYASVFGHVLVGGVHDRNTVSFPDGSEHRSADAFALAVGAGIDIKITPRISIGPQVGYVPTLSRSFTSSTGKHRQDNLLILVSVTIVLPRE